MLTISFRWCCIVEPMCWFKGHRWEEYAVIHLAWNTPGKFCHRCKKSVTRSYEGFDRKQPPTETTEPVLKVQSR